MNDALLPLDSTNLTMLTLAIIAFVTLFRESVKAILLSLEEAGASVGGLFLTSSTWALGVVGADDDFAKATPPGTIGRAPDIARQWLGALLALSFFLAINAVDWASMTLALQGMLGMGSASATPQAWVAFLDKSLALAILLPVIYSGWHLAELVGWSHLLTTAQTTPSWRRVHLRVSSLAFVLSLICGTALGLYRALSLVSSLEPSLLSPDALGSWLASLTVTTMVTMVIALMLCAALACETGVIGLLRVLPPLALLVTHGALWLVAQAWRSLFRLLHSIHSLMVRLGTPLLRIPHSWLIMANRWSLSATGSWRWIGIPVATITGFVYDVDIDPDPRLAVLSPPAPPVTAPSPGTPAASSAGAPVAAASALRAAA